MGGLSTFHSHADGTEHAHYGGLEYHEHRPQPYAGQAVLELWHKHGGWIPGAAKAELAEALGVPVEMLDPRSKR